MSSIAVHAAVVVVIVNECLWPTNDGDNDGADDDVSAFNTRIHTLTGLRVAQKTTRNKNYYCLATPC